MEIQVRISLLTALMIEELKIYYEKIEDIKFSKSDVVIRAISKSPNISEEAWRKIVNEKIKIEEIKTIPNSALRPKLNLTIENEDKIKQLKEFLPRNILDVGRITTGVAINYFLKSAIIEKRKEEGNQFSIEDILQGIKDMCLIKYKDEDCIEGAFDDILKEFSKYEFIVSKK